MTTTEDNKRIVTDYYLTAFAGNPEKAVADHLGDRYIQHNSQAENGPEAFIGVVHWMRGEYPDTKIEIKRVIAEGDLVVTHSHLVLVPGTPGSAVADFSRLENGKIIEYWDVVQEIPETSANDNTMF